MAHYHSATGELIAVATVFGRDPISIPLPWMPSPRPTEENLADEPQNHIEADAVAGHGPSPRYRPYISCPDGRVWGAESWPTYEMAVNAAAAAWRRGNFVRGNAIYTYLRCRDIPNF